VEIKTHGWIIGGKVCLGFTGWVRAPPGVFFFTWVTKSIQKKGRVLVAVFLNTGFGL
jgi:hypothetical protein